MAIRLVLFLILNFAALGLGSYFTSGAVTGEWYRGLNKAPWTPPGWFFGVAWTVIMICFAVFMAMAWERVANRHVLIGLFAVQWVLNVMWNPVFFRNHQVLAGLVVISLLTLLMAFILTRYGATMKFWSFLVVPYVLWLAVATSLNAYILIKN